MQLSANVDVEVRTILRELRSHIPNVRAVSWFRLEPVIQRTNGTIAVAEHFRRVDGLRALVSLDPPSNGVRWLHVSTCFSDHCPSWEDMCDVKLNFMGDVFAIQMHPPRAEWLNRHPYTLHLWHNVLGKTVPDEGQDRVPTDRCG